MTKTHSVQKSRVWMRRGFLVAIASGMVGIFSSVALAAEFVPHRATYVMSLNTSKPGSGISGASGAMTYQFTDACDGWIVENRTVLTFNYTEGGQVATTWDFLTWESKDGLRYRFYMRSTRDGQMSDEIDGTAILKKDQQGGEARYAKPEKATLPLPPGTVFPLAHTQHLIKMAKEGKKFFPQIVFDGSGTEGPFDVTTAIGRQIDASVIGEISDPLLQTTSWSVRMAFFPMEGDTTTPDYEVGLRYHENGIAQNLIQDFGSYTLRGWLSKLEALPKPDC